LVLEPLQEFWGKVQAKTPPDPDWVHPKTLDSIKALYKPQVGKSVDLDVEALVMATRYLDLTQEITALEQHKDQIKAKLIEKMQGAELGILPSGQKITYRTVNRAGYTVEPTSYQTLTIKKKGSR
jgi:predicted phage-related endonuclease